MIQGIMKLEVPWVTLSILLGVVAIVMMVARLVGLSKDLLSFEDSDKGGIAHVNRRAFDLGIPYWIITRSLFTWVAITMVRGEIGGEVVEVLWGLPLLRRMLAMLGIALCFSAATDLLDRLVRGTMKRLREKPTTSKA